MRPRPRPLIALEPRWWVAALLCGALALGVASMRRMTTTYDDTAKQIRVGRPATVLFSLLVVYCIFRWLTSTSRPPVC